MIRVSIMMSGISIRVLEEAVRIVSKKSRGMSALTSIAVRYLFASLPLPDALANEYPRRMNP